MNVRASSHEVVLTWNSVMVLLQRIQMLACMCQHFPWLQPCMRMLLTCPRTACGYPRSAALLCRQFAKGLADNVRGCSLVLFWETLRRAVGQSRFVFWNASLLRYHVRSLSSNSCLSMTCMDQAHACFSPYDVCNAATACGSARPVHE